MKIDSKYFNFKDELKSINNINFFSYVGWSGLYVVKFVMPQTSKITNLQINEIFPDLKKKKKYLLLPKVILNLNLMI